MIQKYVQRWHIGYFCRSQNVESYVFMGQGRALNKTLKSAEKMKSNATQCVIKVHFTFLLNMC